MPNQWVNSQDVVYSQLCAGKTFYNPAFVGTSDLSTFSFIYQQQSLGVLGSAGYTNYAASLDMPLKTFHGGIGAQIYNDVQTGGIRQTGLDAIYSYKIKASRFSNVHAALQVSFGQYSQNNSSLTFETAESVASASRFYLDFSFGVINHYKRNTYLGFAIHHLSEPPLLINESVNLRRKYTLIGCTRILEHDRGFKKQPFIIDGFAAYQLQNYLSHMNVGLNFSIYPVEIGLGARTSQFTHFRFLITSLGLSYHDYIFHYSYNMGMGASSMPSLTIHEVSLIYKFEYEIKKKKGAIKCPKL